MSLHRFVSVAFLIALAAALAACGDDGLRALVTPPAASETPQTGPSVAGPGESPLPALASPLATPAATALPVDTPTPGKAAVAGRLIHLSTNQPMVNQNLSLPSVLCAPGVKEEDKREQCSYVIDEAFDPSVLTDSEGRFVFRDVSAGEYIVLVGNQVTKYAILTNEANQPIIWKIEADKVVDLGDLKTELH